MSTKKSTSNPNGPFDLGDLEITKKGLHSGVSKPSLSFCNICKKDRRSKDNPCDCR